MHHTNPRGAWGSGSDGFWSVGVRRHPVFIMPGSAIRIAEHAGTGTEHKRHRSERKKHKKCGTRTFFCAFCALTCASCVRFPFRCSNQAFGGKCLKASAAIFPTFFELSTSSTFEPVSVAIARQTNWFVLAS